MAAAGVRAPPTAAEAQQQQRVLLRFFAVADLLGFSPRALQRMATVAAAATASTAADVEAVMIAMLVEVVCNAAAPPSSAPTLSPTRSRAVSPAATTPPSTLSSSAACDVLLRPSPCRPSALEAAPWSPTGPTSLPGFTSVACSPSFPLNFQAGRGATYALPPVLRCQRGVRRLDVLDAAFIPHLLLALLRVGGSLEESPEAPPPPPLTPPSTSGDTPAAVSNAQREGCRVAFLQLLQLYAAVVLIRHSGVCAAVAALRERVQQEDSCDDNAATELVDRVRSDFGVGGDQQWAAEFLVFLARAVEGLTVHSRRAALRDLRNTDAGSAVDSTRSGAATPSTRSTTAAAHVDPVREPGHRGASQPTPATSDVDAAEAVWMLEAAGTLLALVDLCLEEASGVDAAHSEGQHSETRKSKDDASTCAGEKATHPPSQDERRHRLRCCSGTTNNIALAAVLTHVSSSLSSPTSSSESHPAVEDAPHCVRGLLFTLFTHHVETHAAAGSTAASATPHEHFLSLLTSQVEEQHKHQHRLLSSTERAVQRVLRLPSVPWHTPSMLVGLCGVTSYQLGTQLRQRYEHWYDVSTHHEDGAHDAAAAADVVKSEDYFISEGREGAAALKAKAAAALDYATTAFGVGLWSDEDETKDGDAAVVVEGASGVNGESAVADAAKVDEHTLAAPRTAGSSPASLCSPSASTATLTVSALHTRASLTLAGPSPPPPPPSRAFRLPCLYTPRASSLARYPTKRGEELRSDEDADGDATAAAAAAATPACAPAASMERLWDIPPRMPRQWTPALATLMACCALCVVPTSTPASRLFHLTGEVPAVEDARRRDDGTVSSNDVSGADRGNGAVGGGGEARGVPLAPFTPIPLPSLSSAQSSTRATPRTSVLDFTFARRRDVREHGTGVAATPPQHPHPLSAATEGVSPMVAVGALAQWHLRCLIQQLLVPGSGVDHCVPEAADGVSGGSGVKASEKSASSLPSGVSRGFSVPSSAGATGGASWFAAYSHANKPAPTRATTTRGAASSSSAFTATGVRTERAGSTGSGSMVVAVARTLSAVAISASAFALHHLLRTQEDFFMRAQLGGSAVQELRRAVAAARSRDTGTSKSGGTAGSVASMLQCVPATPGTAMSRAVRACSSGNGADIGVCMPYQRTRSLWCDAAAMGGLGADRSASALLDALLSAEGEADQHCAEFEGGIEVGSVRHASRPSGNGNGGDGGGSGKSAASPGESPRDNSSSSCALSEALLVTVSFLGCHAAAVALPYFVASVSAGVALLPDHSEGGQQQQQQEWCDALQGLSVVLLDAYRAFRCRQRMQEHHQQQWQQQQWHSQTPPDGEGGSPARDGAVARLSASPLPDAWRGGSTNSTREASPRGASCGAVPSSSTAAQVPRACNVLPPFLSLEAQFGIGAFFVALVRALLQVENVGSGHKQQQQQAARCIAQCLYAVAAVVDDVLHDYRHRPPAAVCDVLAILTHLQLPPSSPSREGGAASSLNAWDALRCTPYWDATLLASLESASRAWADYTARAAAPTVTSALLTLADMKLDVASPCESLLGYIPSSRDPASASWLPPSLRGMNRSAHGAAQKGIEGGAASVLELVALEESFTLAALDPVKKEVDVATSTTSSSHDEISVREPRNDAEESGEDGVGEMAVAVVATRRYARWVSRLGGAWEDAWVTAVVADAGDVN